MREADELVDAVPRCQHCGHLLDAVGPVDRPFWRCTYCGVVSISV